MTVGPPDEPAMVDTTAALASLYQGPFAEFIARRSALVSQLKKSGHKEVAARIATAAKPSRAAYLLNQVYWQARDSYEAVLDAGTAARAAQQARLLGDASTDLTQVMERRDAAVRQAVADAARLAAVDGQPASDAILAQVRESFEALAAHGRDGRLAHGQLTADVELPGLAALAGLVLPATTAPPRRFEVVSRRAAPAPPDTPEPPPDPRIVAAEEEITGLETRAAAARERVEELERGVSAAQARAAEAEAAAQEAARHLDEARRAVERGEAAQRAARGTLDDTTRALEAARERLAALQAPPTAPVDGTPATRGARPRSSPDADAPGPRRPKPPRTPKR